MTLWIHASAPVPLKAPLQCWPKIFFPPVTINIGGAPPTQPANCQLTSARAWERPCPISVLFWIHRASPGCVQISWPSPSPLLPFFLPFSCPLCPPFPPRSLCPALPLPADPRGDPYILLPVPATAPADPRGDPYILINQGRPRSWDVHGSTHNRRTPALTLAPPVAQPALQPAEQH